MATQKENISDEVWSGRQDLVVSQLPMVGASTIVYPEARADHFTSSL